MGLYLPEDDTHPARLDLPVWRHLTFYELHSAELGIGFGAFIVLMIWVGNFEAATPVILIVARVLLGRRRAAGTKTKCNHPPAVHDIRKEPHYFTMAALVTSAMLLALLWGVGAI